MCWFNLYGMEKKMILTFTDHQRLTGLIELASVNAAMPEIVESLYKSLMLAKMLPQERITEDIITMNSKLLLKDLSSGREAELTITYPKDADSRERKVSVFSTIGAALLGRRVGDIVSWKVPAGTGQFEILEIVYQPEAVGDYDL